MVESLNSYTEWMGDFSSQTEAEDMFGWGNTVNGELGLGGIEEEHVLSPRELNFSKATNIKESEFGGLYLLYRLYDRVS
jgi:alpha-tubulin suppressor-like RCC1 family protein